MRKLIYLIALVTMLGCSEQCTECKEITTIENWNINTNTESTRDSITTFEICDVNGVVAVDGIVVVGDVQEIQNNVYRRFTTQILCD